MVNFQPGSITFGSLIQGFAAHNARQPPRTPNLRASESKVSPRCTTHLPRHTDGTRSRLPASIRSGSVNPGFAPIQSPTDVWVPALR